MTKKKYTVLWIIVVLTVIAVLTTVFIVERVNVKDEKTPDRFPQDAIEASLKMTGAGYSVSVEDNIGMLSSIANEASTMYEIAFSGQLVSYMTASDAKTGQLQAEIFYFEYNADAKRLYDKMAENWNFSKEEGEIRVKDKTVYMGYKEALDALED